MLFQNIIPSPKSALSSHQALELASIFLENANKTNDHGVVLVLCHHADAALSQAEATLKKASNCTDPEEPSLRGRIATAYFDLGKRLNDRDHRNEAQAFFNKCVKWGQVRYDQFCLLLMIRGDRMFEYMDAGH